MRTSGGRRWERSAATRSRWPRLPCTYGAFGEARDAVIAVMDTATRSWDYEIIPALRIGDAFEGVKNRLNALSENHVLHGADPCPAGA